MRSTSSAFYSRIEHLIQSWHLSRSKTVCVAMLTIYIDDSGTSSGQSVAVAAGWVAKMRPWAFLDKDWKKVQSVESHKFSCMHMYEFASGHGEFESWDLPKKRIVLKKLIPIIKKRALRGFGLGVIKKDFDEIVPCSTM